MHRYSAAAGGSGVGSSTGGAGGREGSRSDSTFSASVGFTAAARRAVQVTPYKLKCERESLNSRLGPPDFYPPALNCPEESLSRETCQNGYKEAIDGIEEARETSYSLVGNGNSALWTKESINRYKESLRKRLRAVTNSLIRKHKAGQVYDVPLVGPLLAKPGHFPERHTYGEDFRKKWLEDLSQRKRLAFLADHVPHGFHRRTLFEALVKQNVPFLRATWFIKVLYLNQVRPFSLGNSAGGTDKSQAKRLEQWTRDLLDYTQFILDELCQNGAITSRSQPQPGESLQGYDGAEPDAQTKWHYIVRLVQWQYAEGLLQQSQVVDWALKQIQEKDSLEALELMLPLLLESMDALSLSQVHVRMLVDICLSWLRQLGASSLPPNPNEQPQQYRMVVTLVELLRYLLVAVPDTFVAFDCFPLLPCVFTLEGSGSLSEGDVKPLPTDSQKNTNGQLSGSPYREVFIMEVVDSIQKRAASLTKAVNPGILRNNEGKVIQGLDKSLVAGDVLNAYNCVFDSDFSGYEQLPNDWKDFSTNLPFLSGILNNVNLSDLFAVRFLCEWAVCDFRDIRQASNRPERKVASIKDMSRVYMAVSVLCMRKSELESTAGSRNKKSKRKGGNESRLKGKPSANPGPMHDLMVAWIDQHELRKGEGMEKMQLLLCELVRKGIFHPDAYVRQLIVEGVLEKRESLADMNRAARHRRVLRYLPAFPTLELDDGKDTDDIPEIARLYQNERRLALHGFYPEKKMESGKRLKDGTSVTDSRSLSNLQEKNGKRKPLKLAEVKQVVCAYLQIQDTCGGQQKFGAGIGPLVNSKRVVASPNAGVALGCEEYSRNKRQKTGEGKGWNNSGLLGISEPEDTWWLKKLPKVSDPVKSDPSVKPPKQTVRGRPKTVRKTQSLAQLHSARVDGSQGASPSHICDSKIQCPCHRPASGGSKAQTIDSKSMLRSDLRSVGSAIKQLRFPEKYGFSTWLDRNVRNLVGGNGSVTAALHNNANPGASASATADGVRWQLTEERFAAIVYMLDIALNFQSLIRLLLWLLPLSAVPAGISGRTVSTIPVCNKDACYVGEATVLSCLRRYEGVLTSMNLLPEVLTVGMQCASTMMAAGPAGRAACSLLHSYVRDLLRKYSGLASVQAWERDWRVSCDQKVALEFEALKAGDSESGLGFMGMSSSVVGDDRDDPIPQRLNGRLARIGVSMKDNVQKGMGEAVVQIMTREAVNSNDKADEYVHRVVAVLLGDIKQNGSADSALINAAVSAVMNSATSAASETMSSSSVPVSPDNHSIRRARRILLLHVHCLRLLKEALDDRQIRVLDVSLASEAATIVAGLFVHSVGRAPRSQLHLSPETPELGALANDYSTGPNATTSRRAAAATGLVVLAVLQGVVSLERIIALLKIRDGLEVLHLPKLLFGNGLARGASIGSNLKADNMAEAHIYWFRVLIGDCRAVLGGLVADMLGDSNVLALARAQRLLPLNSVFPVAYAMFCGLLRRQVLSQMNITSRDDNIVQSLSSAMKDIIGHEPFREICLQDTRALYLLLSSDTGSSDYAAMLDAQGLDVRSKVEAMLPLPSRLFLHALLDRNLPASMQWQDDEAWMDGRPVYEHNHQMQQIVHILDELQPATFHWQWVELRLLLNEQVFMEKLEGTNTAVKALQASVGGSDSVQLSECEKSFTEVVLTRLLIRPDAAALYSEVLHCLGKPLEEYLIMIVKWVLKGFDVLYGRKSLRQLLENSAHQKGIPVGTSCLKSWGWQPPGTTGEAASPEEGEVSQEGSWRGTSPMHSSCDEAICFNQQFATEKALADLVLPCLARSPNETCSGFAVDLVTQMTDLEQQVTLLTRSIGRLPITSTAIEGPMTKSQGTRRGARSGLEGGSPGVRRRPTTEPSPVSAAALQSSMWLRLQFLLPLLRIIYSDREHSGRNMRLTLAPVLLRLLGTRIVQESAESFGNHQQQQNREGQWNAELASMVAAGAGREDLFDRLLSVLHALLSSTWAVWLKPRGTGKGPAKLPREVPPFDRETADRMQTELDHMQLPRSIRMRLQAAMPVFPPAPTFAVSASPPQVPSSSFNSLQSNLSTLHSSAVDLKSKPVHSLDAETGLDPWTLLEDGTGTGMQNTSGSSNSLAVDSGTLKACPWLKGAIRSRKRATTGSNVQGRGFCRGISQGCVLPGQEMSNPRKQIQERKEQAQVESCLRFNSWLLCQECFSFGMHAHGTFICKLGCRMISLQATWIPTGSNGLIDPAAS